MEPNFSQSNWPSPTASNNQNSGAPKPPPPPPPEITLRTMKSDLESFKQTGGSNPVPKPFTPPEFKSIPVTPPPPPLINPSPAGFPAAAGMPQQKKFSTAAFSGEKGSASSIATTNDIATPPAGKGKVFALIGGLAVTGIVFAIIGYKVVFPLIFKNDVPATTTTDNQANTQAQNTESTAGETVSTSGQPITHQSRLVLADATVSAQISSVSPSGIASALQSNATSAAAGTLTEVMLNDAGGQIAAARLLRAFVPEISNDLAAFFEDDFTAAVYKDAHGLWPAYIFKLKVDPAGSGAQTFLNSTIETSSGLASFFLQNPGTPSAQGFKSGNVSSATTRYLSYSNSGASLNLGWISDKLVISTSFNGLKKVLADLK